MLQVSFTLQCLIIKKLSIYALLLLSDSRIAFITSIDYMIKRHHTEMNEYQATYIEYKERLQERDRLCKER